MAVGRALGIYALSVAFVGLAIAHGGVAHQKPLQVDPDADWATRHMAGENLFYSVLLASIY